MLLNNWKSFVEMLRWRAHTQPDRIACTFLNPNNSSETLSYHALDQQARLIAASIQTQGVKKGDRVLIFLLPGLELIEAFWGCLYAGAVAVPLYPPTDQKLLQKTKRIIVNSQPNLILTTESDIKQFVNWEERPEIQRSSINEEQHLLAWTPELSPSYAFENLCCLAIDKLTPNLVHLWEEIDISPEDIAFLQYTSGSTADPKGVVVRHSNLLDNSANVYDYMGLNESHVMVSWLPPYHDMGLIGGILMPLYGGYPSILMSPFSFLHNPLSWLKNIHKYQATLSGAPNFAFDYCVKRIKEDRKTGLDLSSWRLAFNAAEPVRDETMERFYQAFKNYGFRKEVFYPGYGLAEATLLVSGSIPGKLYRTVDLLKSPFHTREIRFISDDTSPSEIYRLVSSGRIIQPIKIVNPETRQECANQMIGEIWVQGPSVAGGYWQQEGETEETFSGRIQGDLENKVYLRTGDLGFIHDGELYISGRIKDLIILYGKNHYPQDIEYTLYHCALNTQLSNVAAFTIEIEKEYQLALMCELKKESLEKKELEILFNAIFEVILQENQLKVHTIALIPSRTIPKTTSGKIRRNFCRQSLLTESIPIIARWQRKEVEVSC